MDFLKRVAGRVRYRQLMKTLPLCPACGHIAASTPDAPCATSVDAGFGDEADCACTNREHALTVTGHKVSARV
jgi:hypothetical protein